MTSPRSPQAPPSVSLPPVSLPAPIPFRSRTLQNGLLVVSCVQDRAPIVAVQVWYRVGSKDDPANRSGFAHLFEHLMFKRTTNMADETLDRLTEDVGGENNAFTSADQTVYHETVPSAYLETLLWAEAERMANLQVDPRNFVSERDVVKEEFRQSVLADPYGRFADAIETLSWREHPYKRPTIGNIAELNAATIDDVRAFHATFYRPDNAILIVTGDFDPGKFDSWVDRYFGRLTAPKTEIPRVTVREPARTAPARFSVTRPNVPLPAVGMTFLTPNSVHPDAPALKVLATILSGGESARLFRELVYRKQIASEADAGADLRADAGLFTVTAKVAGKKTPDELERAVLAELEKVRTEPVADTELRRAKDRLIVAALRSRETADGVAFALGDAAFSGDVARANTEPAELEAVTVADCLRVAREYLGETNRVVVRYGAGPETRPIPVEPPKAPLGPKMAPTGTEKPPAPSPPRPLVLPKIADRKLANGLRVIAAERAGSGLVSCRVLIFSGATLDPASKAGRASFLAQMLTRGTRTKSAEQLAELAETLGGSLFASADRDTINIGITVPASRLERALELLADVARHPALAPGEIERLRAEKLDEYSINLQEPGFLASAAARRLVFEGSPYGRLVNGTGSSVRRLTRTDLLAAHDATFQPRNAALLIVGAVESGDAFQKAARFFDDWKSGARPAPSPPRVIIPPVSRRVVAIDLPGSGQTAVVLIRPGIARTDLAYARAEVAVSVYGSGYSSRLNQEVRIRRGLAYGAFASLDAAKSPGPLLARAQTRHEAAAQVASLLIQTLEKVVTDPLPDAELVARKSALAGPYAAGLQTGDGLAGVLADLATHNLPLRPEQFLESVKNVTADDVRRIAASRLGATYASLVLVGETRKFLPELKTRFGRVTVLPAKL